jgi:hypothetical protein
VVGVWPGRSTTVAARWRPPSRQSTCRPSPTGTCPSRCPCKGPRPGGDRGRDRAGLRRVHPLALHHLPGRSRVPVGGRPRGGDPVLHQHGDRALHPGHRRDRPDRLQPLLAALGAVLRRADLPGQRLAGLDHQLGHHGHLHLRRRERDQLRPPARGPAPGPGPAGPGLRRGRGRPEPGPEQLDAGQGLRHGASTSPTWPRRSPASRRRRPAPATPSARTRGTWPAGRAGGRLPTRSSWSASWPSPSSPSR